MATHYDPETNPAFDILAPEVHSSPIVINSPHSGRVYLDSFMEKSRLGHLAIRKSEDFMVDYLVEGATEFGMSMLRANFPRAYLDVNREPFELDPTMFEGKLPDYVNTRSMRVSSGLGTIARIVAEGEGIYASNLSVTEGLARIEELYRPYHATLGHLLARTHVEFGVAILLDCHSMPSSGGRAGVDGARPDFILGDRFGSSCSPKILHNVRTLLTDMGYRVEINKPYAGGFITEHYGRPENGLHALQIEINRSIYMDETRIKPGPGMAGFKQDMNVFFNRLACLRWDELQGSYPLAAE